jgi:hypothetical protein
VNGLQFSILITAAFWVAVGLFLWAAHRGWISEQGAATLSLLGAVGVVIAAALLSAKWWTCLCYWGISILIAAIIVLIQSELELRRLKRSTLPT